MDVNPATAIRPSLATSAIGGGLWGRLATVHREVALRHQWDQLVATGALEAFEIAAGRRRGVPSVTFTSDSDVHKWLDAVARHLPAGVPDDVAADFEATVALLEEAQEPDGYLNAWIQALFPGHRFRNLQTEHESYTTGHLVEAAVSLFDATGDDRLLDTARRAVEALRGTLEDLGPERQDGHEEIELALVRLHRATGDRSYLELARRSVDVRGTSPSIRRQARHDHVGTARRLLSQFRSRRAHRRSDPDQHPRSRPAVQQMELGPSVVRRGVASFASGRHWQNDRPARQLTDPTGHAVAFHYLHTAMTMLAAELGDPSLRAATVTAWERELAGHLFVNGGAGAMAFVEGFGDPYDLDPERAYCETCASLSAIVWNRELGLLTDDARHDDLAEWQLLNGAAVGMSLDGTRWAYNNPLQVAAGFDRREWYPVPCCPSNLSRTWASIPQLATSRRGDEITVHQYVSCRTLLDATVVEIDSALPWSGDVVIRLAGGAPARLRVRVPSWAEQLSVEVDGVAVEVSLDARRGPRRSASGLQPQQARWARVALPATLDAAGGCEVRVTVDLPIRLLRQDRRVPRVGGGVAVARGPLLFCLEGVDHVGCDERDHSSLQLDVASLSVAPARDLLEGAITLEGRTSTGRALRFVPYFLWGNRGAGPMTVFVRA